MQSANLLLVVGSQTSPDAFLEEHQTDRVLSADQHFCAVWVQYLSLGLRN